MALLLFRKRLLHVADLKFPICLCIPQKHCRFLVVVIVKDAMPVSVNSELFTFYI